MPFDECIHEQWSTAWRAPYGTTSDFSPGSDLNAEKNYADLQSTMPGQQCQAIGPSGNREHLVPRLTPEHLFDELLPIGLFVAAMVCTTPLSASKD
jgi:hypothetical protein